MTGALGRWLMGVVLTAFAVGLARQMAGGGRERALVGLAGGLALTAALLGPLADGVLEDLDLSLLPSQSEAADQAEVYRQENIEALAAVIEEETAAYIWDKAEALGLDCWVEVTAAAGEDGVPLPDTVTIRGPYSEALSAVIEEEVGIPAGRQIWLKEETWQEKEGASP